MFACPQQSGSMGEVEDVEVEVDVGVEDVEVEVDEELLVGR